MASAAACPKHRERVLTQRIDDAVVLLDADSGKYYSLDEVGGRTWELCDGSRTLHQLIAAICEEYEASEQVVEADVTELLRELAGENLVVYSP
jgi:trimethylamine:corrinoid methyltransferase-like protein